jgi:hypothetical protein
MMTNSERKIPIETLVTAKLWIKILIYFPASGFLFVNRVIGEGFSKVLATDNQQMPRIHIVGRDGNTPLVALGQLFPAAKKLPFI